MSPNQVRIAGVGLAFLLIIVSGIWMSHLGKPYNTPLFTVHKLVGLALGVFLAVVVHQTNQVAPLALGAIAAIAVTALLFAGIVVTGGLLGVGKPMAAVVHTLHRVIPVLTLLSTAGTLYLLLAAS